MPLKQRKKYNIVKNPNWQEADQTGTSGLQHQRHSATLPPPKEGKK